MAPDKQQLAAWGLPQTLLAAFERNGLKSLYPWQAAALECAAGGGNLVYCAPTSGGKSLVAEVLMLARLHATSQQIKSYKRGKNKPVTRGLLVLPYISIVAEKTVHLTKLLAGMKWRVQGYKGETEGQPLASKFERIAICSIEKANMAVNLLVKEERLHELVSVVVDEAHMLADPHRGAALEMLLSKLVACKSSCAMQIVAMSATMGGLDTLSTWLNAHLFLTNFRPVPLTEHAVFGGTVYVKAAQGPGAEADCPLVEQRRLEVSGSSDRESLLQLVAEVVLEQHSVLVFCAGRSASQSCAVLLAEQLGKLVGPPSPTQAAGRAELLEQLRLALGGSVSAEMQTLIAAGVAYHHAGLTHQERGLIEDGYRSGTLLVLTATSTLAAGVNLPARRVILRSLWQGRGIVGRAQYLQMVGRAGRAGQSAVGESFLMGHGTAGAEIGQWSAVCNLIRAPMPRLTTQLLEQFTDLPITQKAGLAVTAINDTTTGNRAPVKQEGQQLASLQQIAAVGTAEPNLQHLLLHGVATGLVNCGQSVYNLLKSTLAFQQVPFELLATAAKAALTALRDRKLISLKAETSAAPSHWMLTPLGSAVVASTLPPDLGLLLHNRLSNLLSCLVMGGHAHLLFVLQPDPLFCIYDWKVWSKITRGFSDTHRRIAELEDVDMAYVARRVAGMRGDTTTDARHARFAGAILLDCSLAETGQLQALEEVWGAPNGLTKAGITRGQMQQWQTEISKTAAMATLLANKADWWQLEALLAPLAAQAAAGVRPELLPLMKVPGMQPAHAAALYAAGLKRPEQLVAAAESEVAAALASKLPANMRKRKELDKTGLSIGVGGTASTSALVTRASKSILDAARQHAMRAAAALSAEELDVASTQEKLHSVLPMVFGQATVHQVWPRKEDPMLQQLLDSWTLQPTFSFAVVLDRRQVAASMAYTDTPCGQVSLNQQLAAIAICWSHNEAVVLHMSAPVLSADDQACSNHVWAVVKAVFKDANRTAVCCNAPGGIAALAAAGIQCKLVVDDPAAAFGLWQPAAGAQVAGQNAQQQQLAEQHVTGFDTLAEAQRVLLGGNYKLQVPLMGSQEVTAAVRTALLGYSLMPPLRAMLVQQQLWSAYEGIERPLQQVLAHVRHQSVAAHASLVSEQLQVCQAACRVLLQQSAYMLGDTAAGCDLTNPTVVQSLLANQRLIAGRHRQQLLADQLVLGIKGALQWQRKQHLLPLLRCLLSFWRIHSFEQRVNQVLQTSVRHGSYLLLKCQPMQIALYGTISLVKPTAEAALLLSPVAVPAFPSVVCRYTPIKVAVTGLPTQSQLRRRQQQSEPKGQHGLQWAGTLCPQSQCQNIIASGSQLPHDGCSAICTGDVCEWCSAQRCVVGTGAAANNLFQVLPLASSLGSEVTHMGQTFLPDSISLMGAICPCTTGSTFIGVHLQLLQLFVVAAVSGDQHLMSAFATPDPMAAAAAHWLQASGIKPAVANMLQARVQAGVLDGMPTGPDQASASLFSSVMNMLILGQKPSAQRSMLALKEPIHLTDTLLQAFHGLKHWVEALLEECRQSGYLQTLLGRKIPFKLPAADPTASKNAAWEAKQAVRSAISIALMASCGDVERSVIAACHVCCKSDREHIVMCGHGLVVAEVPAACALQELQRMVPAVRDQVASCLPVSTSVVGALLKWWWGTSMDLVQANYFEYSDCQQVQE